MGAIRGRICQPQNLRASGRRRPLAAELCQMPQQGAEIKELRPAQNLRASGKRRPLAGCGKNTTNVKFHNHVSALKNNNLALFFVLKLKFRTAIFLRKRFQPSPNYYNYMILLIIFNLFWGNLWGNHGGRWGNHGGTFFLSYKGSPKAKYMILQQKIVFGGRIGWGNLKNCRSKFTGPVFTRVI
ncbi:MAG: hypothetical protein M0Z52_07425 [Actinomycetota bacterium]|nr:hypothetical protein [Actinomycetota bacterium]